MTEQKKYTTVQITVEAHEQLKQITEQLSQKLFEQTGFFVKVTKPHVLSYCVSETLKKMSSAD